MKFLQITDPVVYNLDLLLYKFSVVRNLFFQ